MPNNIYNFGFNNHLTKPPLLKLPSAARHGFAEGVDPSKISFNDPYFSRARFRGKTVTISPGQSIQKAIDTVHDQGGGIVFLENGTYYPKGSLTLYSDTTVEGEGIYSTIIDFENGAYSVNIHGSNAYETGTVSATFDSATITGSGTTWTSSMVGQTILLDGNLYTIAAFVSTTQLTLDIPLITTTASGLAYVIADFISGVFLEKLTIQNSTANLVDVLYGLQITLTLVTLDTGLVGFDCQQSYAPQFINSTALNCTNGIKLSTCYFYTMNTFSVYNCSGDGFVIATGGNSSVFDFSVYNCGGVGIKLTNASIISFFSLTIDSHDSHGFEFVSGNSDIQINDALIDLNGGDGVKLTASSNRIAIYGSEFTNNTGYGVNIVAASCNDNIVLGNAFSGNATANMNNSGTNTQVVGNINIGSQTSSTATDNFQIRTLTNTPNPNWEIGVGNGAGALDTSKAFIYGIGARVGVGTTSPNEAASLDVSSTVGGVLVPRMTTTQRDAISAVNGLIIYNSTLNKFQGYEAGAWVNLI